MPPGPRPKFEWTPYRQRLVRYEMGQGTRKKHIAEMLGCDEDTLHRYLNQPAGKP